MEQLKKYPLERIQKTKGVLQAFWNGQDIGRPVVVTIREQPTYQQQFDLEKMMCNALECLTTEALLPGDNVPGFYPDLGPIALASAFGGILRYEENGPPWIDPIIYKAEDVYALKMPSVQDGLVGELIRRVHIFLERCQGKIAVRMLDMQGPLNTAGLIWEQQDFLMSMRTHPREVHYLVNLVTDYIIQVVNAFKSEFGDQLDHPQWPPIWMAPGDGIGLIEDLLPLISVISYREFGLPYSTRIAKTFGGVFIHCCGECERHLPVLAEIPGLRGLDFSCTHTRPEAVQEILGDGRRAFSFGPSARGMEQFSQKFSFLKYQRTFYEKGMRVIFYYSVTSLADLREALQILGVENTWEWPDVSIISLHE